MFNRCDKSCFISSYQRQTIVFSSRGDTVMENWKYYNGRFGKEWKWLYLSYRWQFLFALECQCATCHIHSSYGSVQFSWKILRIWKIENRERMGKLMWELSFFERKKNIFSLPSAQLVFLFSHNWTAPGFLLSLGWNQTHRGNHLGSTQCMYDW